MGGTLKERLASAAAAGSELSVDLDPVFGALPSGQKMERLSLSQLVPWSSNEYETQPFHPYTAKDMQDLMENMDQHGLHSPILVRPFHGKYQILAGHNRAFSAQNLGWTEIDAIIKYGLSDADAADIMVDTNFNQRPRILPSERAWGWKIKMDNMKHQGKSNSTSSHGGTKLRSDAELAEAEGTGRSTIQRYISLTRLIRPLLDIVDGYQYSSNASDSWELNADKPMLPITAAERLVDLTVADQEYLVALFTGRVITSINKSQAAELKAAASPGERIPPKVIRRCLGLEDTDVAKMDRPYVLKFTLSPSLFSTEAAEKYIGDTELQARIIGEIERYIAEQEEGISNAPK